MPPKVLRVKNIEPHGDQRAGLTVEQSMRFGGTDQVSPRYLRALWIAIVCMSFENVDLPIAGAHFIW
jgi:hypothetical protein